MFGQAQKKSGCIEMHPSFQVKKTPVAKLTLFQLIAKNMQQIF